MIDHHAGGVVVVGARVTTVPAGHVAHAVAPRPEKA